MTKKEKAIVKLTQLKDYYDQLDLDQDTEDDEDPTNERDILDALNMAIQALEKEPCPYWDYGLNTCRHANIGALATKPYGDAVSRVEVIDELNRLGRNAFKEDTDYDNFFSFLDGLPSVTPIRPKGEWETGYTFPDGVYWKCSVCKELIRVRIPMHFCSNCGADMDKEGE